MRKVEFSEEDKNDIINFYVNKGFGLKHLAKLYNVTSRTIKARLVEWEIEIRPPCLKVEFSPDIRNEIITLYNNGHSPEHIGNIFGVSNKTIIARLKEWDVFEGDRSYITFTDLEREKIIELAKNKYSTLKIAEIFGVSSDLIRRRLKEWGVNISQPYNHNFSNKERMEIIRLYCIEMLSTKEIASMFNCSEEVIRQRLIIWGIPRRTRIYTADDSFFNNINSEEKAYVLSFISSDGSVTDNYLQIGLHKKDAGHLYKIIKILGATNPVHIYGKTAQISICSNQMVEDLHRYGVVERKSKILEPCYTIPTYLLRHYWRGFVDGDGSIFITADGRVNIYLCGTWAVCNAFREWCQLYTKSKANVTPMKSIFHYGVSGPEALPIIDALYSNTNIYLDRKYNLAMKVLENYGRSTIS